jgi:mRNA-degrading endonuclease toxin of MazEF toxin-antitoxin module
VHRLRSDRQARGREQRGRRFAVVLQADNLPAVDRSRLGEHVGRVSPEELLTPDEALRAVLSL